MTLWARNPENKIVFFQDVTMIEYVKIEAAHGTVTKYLVYPYYAGPKSRPALIIVVFVSV